MSDKTLLRLAFVLCLVLSAVSIALSVCNNNPFMGFVAVVTALIFVRLNVRRR